MLNYVCSQGSLELWVFFVLSQGKGNRSGSWASPQEVSLGLIKGTDARWLWMLLESVRLEITRQAAQEKLEPAVSLARPCLARRPFPLAFAEHSLLCVLITAQIRPLKVCVSFCEHRSERG